MKNNSSLPFFLLFIIILATLSPQENEEEILIDVETKYISALIVTWKMRRMHRTCFERENRHIHCSSKEST